MRILPLLLLLAATPACAGGKPYEPPYIEPKPQCEKATVIDAVRNIEALEPMAQFFSVANGIAKDEILSYLNALPPPSSETADQIIVLYLPAANREKDDEFLFLLTHGVCAGLVIELDRPVIERLLGKPL